MTQSVNMMLSDGYAFFELLTLFPLINFLKAVYFLLDLIKFNISLAHSLDLIISVLNSRSYSLKQYTLSYCELAKSQIIVLLSSSIMKSTDLQEFDLLIVHPLHHLFLYSDMCC